MPNYAVSNPGKYHLGFSHPSPPYQNVKYDILRIPFKEVRWKASTLINRKVYIGNVKITKSDGSVHIEPDTIYKSRVNKFDTFTDAGKITVASGDGEDIIALVDYADRLLQFKDKTLHIINVQQKEFLEDSHKHKGISNIQAVVKTDFGVAWANSHGAYLYDGRSIVDLLENKGLRTMTFAQWDSFVTSKTTVGYIPDKRQLLFVDAYDDSANGDLYLYDMTTKSWVKGKAKLDINKTNFSTSHDGKLIWGRNSSSSQYVYKWDEEAKTSGNILIKTADIDFEHPGINKKVSKVIVTYKCPNDTKIDLTYGTDGGATNKTFYKKGESSTSTLQGTSGAWETQEFVPSNKDQGKCRSIQLQFETASGQNTITGFAINDISIIYRPKRVK